MPAPSFTFVQEMQERSFAALDRLHRDVVDFTLVDFPDHDNVGDSAIYLGQLAFWHARGLRPTSVYSKDTYVPTVKLQGDVLIHGGGNFGGLYPAHSRLRYGLARSLSPTQNLIQLPQSVEFLTDADRLLYAQSLGARDRSRIGVRDLASQRALEGSAAHVVLAPDSVHALGLVDAPDPYQDELWLVRSDQESAGTPGATGRDWSPLTLTERLGARLRVKGVSLIPARTFNKTPAQWAIQAHVRFQRGVQLLAPGRTIVTDRLHAMLIALQMGRRVVVVDNSVKKLTRYLDTWFQDFDAPVELADSFTQARRLSARKF